ncbi:fungal-specific transcription factor domain-containing protein [Thelonectria olida]|uniref:Fungal-specific transcription factor domain-containing protein n=1 Tax=Thelonectria olida TaxID=1576542 RepID=A0A9P8WBH8_9HYPO|nr:fungal-specific transcription factor domain-containing protein [Thelonectria olida]
MTTTAKKSDSLPSSRPIRFVNNQGQPPSKRRRIGAACLTCRRRKTRCAGERPLCSTCTKNGHKCLGYPEDNKKEEGENLAGLKPEDEQDLPEIHHVEDSNPHKPDVRVKAPPDVPPLQLSEVPLQTKTPEPTQDALSMTPQVAQCQPPENYLPTSPTAIRRTENHRVPYFRYFGPTAIVPGFKQMVVSVRDRRRSTAGSASGTSPLSTHSGALGSSSAADSEVIIEDLPVYDPNDPLPVHPLITNLINTFFLQMGSSYPFLKQPRFLRMVHEKRAEPILVDSICSLAARFSDSPALTGGNDKMPRTDRGATFAQRARQATVDTFPCPTVGAVQACLLMAYEGFGASQDSALWMYLGLAIRMAVDLGLQKEVGVQYQGEKDPLYRSWSRNPDEDSPEAKESTTPPNPEEEREVVQERMDTFWAIFILDRVISSGTGRPVTFRDDDFELTFPEPSIDAVTKWPALFPVFLQIIHLYGRVCDVLNKIRDAHDLNKDTWTKLAEMEHELTRLYKSWDWRLQFNVSNFKAYLGAGHGTTFILLHFWFHALLIILHQPMLLTPFAELRSELQLLQDSRELSMSSAKTICDILSFADLIDPKSFVGNPFTSQPIYIAACAFLMESSANASESPSRANSPPGKRPEHGKGKSRHSLLASAANQNYQRCYSSLQQIQLYWGGVKYILTALDQKAKGIWDCETYTSEEYESTKRGRRDSRGAMSNPFRRFENQVPKASGPPIAWSLSGTANSPNSSLTLMYQNLDSGGGVHPPQAAQTSTPPGNMVFDPIRQSLPESTTLLAPAYQTNPSAARPSPRPGLLRRQSNMSAASGSSRPTVKFANTEDGEEIALKFKPTSQQSNGVEGFSISPPSTLAGVPTAVAGTPCPAPNPVYYPPGPMPYPMQWTPSMGNIDAITFDSQDIDIGALGLQQPELMGPWLELIPSEMLGLFENQDGQGP